MKKIILLAISLSMGGRFCLAQWNANPATGNYVCNFDNSSKQVKITSDGNGGTILLWSERNNTTYDRNLYIQRTDANGFKLWGEFAITITSTPGSASPYGQQINLIEDGEGGAYILWQDPDGSHAQRIGADGQSLWASGGIPISSGEALSLIKETDGFIVAGQGHIQKVLANGQTSWSNIYDNGSGGTHLNATVNNTRLVSDGNDGAFLVWTSSKFGGQTILCQRFSSAGAPMWIQNGKIIASSTQNASAPDIAAKSGGCFVSYTISVPYNPNTNKDAYHYITMNELDFNGVDQETYFLGTGANDLAISHIVPDGQNGAWYGGSGLAGILMAHVRAGQVLSSTSIDPYNGNDFSMTPTEDGTVVTFTGATQHSSSSKKIQLVTDAGRQWQSTNTENNNAVLLATDSYLNESPELIKTADGSYIAAWVMNQNNSAIQAIAAAKILPSGMLASVALPTTTASATQLTSGNTPLNFTSGSNLIINLTPGGTNPVSGTITASVAVDEQVNSFGDIPYVTRHYDIEPTDQPSTATAQIKLFFTQSDFDLYNTYVTNNHLSLPLLPTGPLDGANLSAVTITQYHGSGSTPGNYTGTTVLLHPTAEQILWNSNFQRWEITLDITGFSGFYLGSTPAALPVNLMTFSGSLKNGWTNLSWQTALETNLDHIEIQKSLNGKDFLNIKTIAPKGDNSTYSYLLTQTEAIAYYRLQFTLRNKSVNYSKAITLTGRTTHPTLFPNPATDHITIEASAKGEACIYNAAGIRILKRSVGKGTNTIDITGLPPGTYFLQLQSQGYSFIKVGNGL